MLIYAAVFTLPLVSTAIGLVGLGGLVFTALSFRRSDTTAIVQQQTIVFDDLKGLNEELRLTTDRLRSERDTLKYKVTHLTGQNEALRDELRDARAEASGKVTRIERKSDDSAS